ncbi:MAG: hypothetical protein AABY07_10925 [Nanoarchaeota archaeon]
MVELLRGMIGDKGTYHNPLWYEKEELEDKLELALFRHKPNLMLDTLPKSETLVLCYRAAIDLCLELAGRNAPFAILNIEGMSVDKTGVMNNWLQLSDKYRDYYLTEINGGLGAEGNILQGDLTRTSSTTGREVPYHTIKAFDPVTVSLVSIVGLLVKIDWTPTRDTDFYAYIVYRRNSPTGIWTEVSSIYNLLNYDFEETLTAAGKYDYKVDTVRAVSVNRTIQYPFNPMIGKNIATSSNILTVDVV